MLESLLRQSHRGFEIVLVDDASTDGSVRVAREVCGDRIRIHENPVRLGIAANWNRVVEVCATPYVCIAHQDDVYAADYAAAMLAALAGDPRCAMVHCRAATIDETGARIRSPIEEFKERFWQRDPAGADRRTLFRLLLQGNFICCSSSAYRTEALRAVGPFDAGLQFTLDWQMSFRILLAGWDIRGLPERLVRYRRHRGNATLEHVRTHDRYREELRVLAWARAAGIAAGLLDADAPRSRAVRNNLLYDCYADLRHGSRSAALARLEFGRHEVPGFAADPMARSVALCARAGALGLPLLRLGLWTYLRLLPGRVSP